MRKSAIREGPKTREIDERLAKLPREFRDRFVRFRCMTFDFDRKFGGYEIGVCEQAVALAKHLKTADAAKAFRKMNYEEQRADFPGLDAGHSGNSFGAMVNLAHIYLDRPDLVEKWHGSLCALVGCDAYGCYAAYPDEEDVRVKKLEVNP